MKILNKKVLIVIILFFSFLIFNNSNCFAYDNYFNFKLDGTDDVSFNRSTMELTVNDNVYNLVCNNLPENYTNISVVRESYSAGETWGIFFTPSTADKLKLFNPYYSSRKNLNDYDIYYLARPTKTECTVYRTGEGACYINSCRFSTIDVYDYLDTLVCAGVKKTPKVTPTLYIDDQNLKKRFKFQFEIPLEKEDTKYYVFLQKYTRNSYDSVTATFTIYTVDTPENYDATNYENYMYYDLPSKGLYLPAGTVVKWYNCTINNGSLATLNFFNEFVPARKSEQIYDTSYTLGFLNTTFEQFTLLYSLDYLFPTSTKVENFNGEDVIYKFLSNTEFSTDTKPKFKINVASLLEYLGVPSVTDAVYKKVLHSFYYADENYLFLPFDDLAFSNFSIVSYENEKYTTSKSTEFYKIYRKTKVYNQENKIDDVTFAFNYSDGQDVSSLLPADMNKDYLTSPFFKDNENSTSKGNITYDINEIIQGDKIIDYSKEDNSIHNNFNGDYIENFKEGDNITINNYYTETIEKTSDSHLLHNIYIEILEIKTLIASMDDFVSNETNNFTYNIENNIKYYLIPSKIYIKQNLSEINSTAKKNLGIIYEPVEFLIYTVTLFSKIDSTDDIVLNIPDIEYKNTYLLHSTTINFTSQMQNLPILGTMHNIYLTCVDFVILGLLIAYAIKVSKEVFNK